MVTAGETQRCASAQRNAHKTSWRGREVTADGRHKRDKEPGHRCLWTFPALACFICVACCSTCVAPWMPP